MCAESYGRTIQVPLSAACCLVQRVKKAAYGRESKRLHILAPGEAGNVRVIPARVSTERDMKRCFLVSVLTCAVFRFTLFIEKHGGVQVGIDARIGAERCQVTDIAVGIRRQGSEDLSDPESVPDERQRQLKGICVNGFADAEHSIREGFPETFHGGARLIPIGVIVEGHAERRAERVILRGDPVHLVEPCQFDRGGAESLLQVLCGRSCLRIQDQIEIGLRHGKKVVVVPAGGHFADRADADLPQKITKFAVPADRCKIAHDIDAVRLLIHGSKKAVNGLPHMDHGRLAAFSGERVHITGPHADPGILRIDELFRFPAHSLHIRAEERVHTGDADHDYRRLLGKSVYHLAHSFRYASEVSAGDKIRLIHSQIEETVFVSLHGTDRGCIPPAAAGRYDQHHGSGNRKACSLDAKTFRAGGIKGQSRG